MTSLHLQFDRRAAAVVEARARAHDYAHLSVFPGRP
jgi:hypothetical protein